MNINRKTVPVVLLLICAAACLFAEVNVNSPAPAIVLRDLDGRLVFGKNLLMQKPLLISFFFTGCKPCEKELPELERMKLEYGKKINFYLVSTDSEGADAVIPWVKKKNVTLNVLIDRYSDAARDFGVNRYPSVFIISRNGRVKYSCVGYKEDNIKCIERVLKSIR